MLHNNDGTPCCRTAMLHHVQELQKVQELHHLQELQNKNQELQNVQELHHVEELQNNLGIP